MSCPEEELCWRAFWRYRQLHLGPQRRWRSERRPSGDQTRPDVCPKLLLLWKGYTGIKMLGKYTKEGGRLPGRNCLPSVEQPGTRRAYFPNSPWLSGLRTAADARQGQGRGISSATSFPRPSGTPRDTWTALFGDVRADGDGVCAPPQGALPSSARVA